MNKDKRALYDQYGHAGLDPNFARAQSGENMGGFGDMGNMGDMFGQGFGGFHKSNTMGNSGNSRGSKFETRGFGGSSFNDFTFQRAEEIFKDFFAGNGGFFDDDDDDIGGAFMMGNKIPKFHSERMNVANNGKKKKNSELEKHGFHRQMTDPFNDDFFGGFGGGMFGGGGFGDMGNFHRQFSDNMDIQMGSMGRSGGGGGGHMTSVSTSTIIRYFYCNFFLKKLGMGRKLL